MANEFIIRKGFLSNANSVISGSLQLTGSVTSNSFIKAGASSNDILVGDGTTFSRTGIVSGSSQVSYTALSSIPSGIVSGAAQVTPLLPTGTISGSAQVTGFDNYVSWTLAGNSGTNQTISSTNTATISGSHGLTAIGENTDRLNLRHANNITAGSANSTGTSTLTYGGTFVVPSVSYDANGHITSTSTSTLTMPASDNTNTVTRLNGTGGTLVSGDVLIQGTGLVSTSQSGQTITIATTATNNTGTVTSVATGTGLSGGTITTTGTISLSLNSLSEKTGNLVGTDRLVGLTGTTHWAETISAIPLSIFSNDSGWTSTAGTVTSVASGNGMNFTTITGTGTVTMGTPGTIDGSSTNATTATSHTHAWSNTPGYITGYTETDTLSSVTGRGATTATAITFTNATASTTYGTGAVIISGGLGVAGNINAGGEVTAYAASDIRLKHNITPITNPIYKVQQLSGNTFDWDENLQDLHKGSDIGVIAQEVELLFPSLVSTRENGYLGVKYEKIVPLLIEAIKEQQNQIEDLKKEIFKLKRK
jgi:hypothetical protein